uniref:Uncharacterized protein n=1 Tax=Marseillevirus LCMAC101 TaxID=2506602 RepID=A0A481YTX9_9VIRU|nr:MAG: hypothetical protein LCMAC101_05690 [Marseillevirus LCMAC101]
MIDLFISLFVITALALTFAHAWNLVAETALQQYERKDAQGNVQKPVFQTLIYALAITAVAVFALWYIHYYTKIDLAAGHRRAHRSAGQEFS